MTHQKIFFSYSRSDASDFVMRLYYDLKKIGADVWIDQLDIKIGKRWDIEISKALKDSPYVLFIISEGAVNSENVLDEVFYSLEEKKYVIPIIIGQCDIPYRIRRLQTIDFRNDYDLKLNILVEVLNLSNQPNPILPIEIPNKESSTVELSKANQDFDNNSYETAAIIYLKNVDKLSDEQYDRLGHMFHFGLGVKEDITEAEKWYKRAAELGNTNSMRNIGLIYLIWIYDDVKALEWFRKAAENGNAKAMYEMGVFYKNGKGVNKDYIEAMKWYKKADEKNIKEAIVGIAELYRDGLGVDKNTEKAIDCFGKAIENGSEDAMYELAVLYENGTDLKKDFSEALKLYVDSANKEHEKAVEKLASIYYNGINVKQDYFEAIKWYKKAAEKGNEKVFFTIGTMYENGQGVTKNLNEAVKWYEKAAENGEELAEEKLKYLRH